jgi:alpha-N-arabinofuranosidase
LISYGSPPYYVQKMFNNARGDQVLPIASITPETIPTLPPSPEPPPPTTATSRPGRFRPPPPPPNPNEPLFACASKEDGSGDIILKVANVFDTEQAMTVELAGASVLKNATAQVMVGKPDDTNSIEAPLNIVPKQITIDDASNSWNHTFPGNSISVIRFKTK